MGLATLKVDRIEGLGTKIVIKVLGGDHHNTEIHLSSMTEIATLLEMIIEKGKQSMTLDDSYLSALRERKIGTWTS